MPPVERLRVREQDLARKVAVVTGASKGIGRAIALNLASRGCSVVGTCSSRETLHLIDSLSSTVTNLYREAAASPVPKVHGVIANIASVTAAECLDPILSALSTRFGGRVDIVINNAAVIQYSLVGSMTEDQVAEMLRANVQMPTMLVSTLVEKKMFRANSRIVNISSDFAHGITPGVAGWALYSAVKAAIEALARAWADELGAGHEFMKGTTANSVSVGVTDTDAVRNMPPQARPMVDNALQRQSLGHDMARSEDVADVVGLLCGKEARWITGQVIGANGGAIKIGA